MLLIHSQAKRGGSLALHFSGKAHGRSVLTNAILMIVLNFLSTCVVSGRRKRCLWSELGEGNRGVAFVKALREESVRRGVI